VYHNQGRFASLIMIGRLDGWALASGLPAIDLQS
jgi:hypothetical protein